MMVDKILPKEQRKHKHKYILVHLPGIRSPDFREMEQVSTAWLVLLESKHTQHAQVARRRMAGSRFVRRLSLLDTLARLERLFVS